MKQEITKKIAASPRILESGTKEVIAAFGMYQEPDTTQSNGIMAGFKTNLALTKSASLSLETVCTNLFDNEVPILYGSDLGLAFKVGKHTIVSLDWLVGGEKDDIAHGLKSTLLFCLEKGYIEGLAFYVPEEVSQGVRTSAGQGSKIVGVWDFSKNWSLRVQGEARTSILEMEPFESKMGQLALINRWGKNNQNSVTLISNIEEKNYISENMIEKIEGLDTLADLR